MAELRHMMKGRVRVASLADIDKARAIFAELPLQRQNLDRKYTSRRITNNGARWAANPGIYDMYGVDTADYATEYINRTAAPKSKALYITRTQRPGRAPTQKQLDALARGRGLRALNLAAARGPTTRSRKRKAEDVLLAIAKRR